MSGNQIVIFVLLTMSIINISSADVIHSTWIGQDTGDWTSAMNWSPYSIPLNNAQNTYAVTINTSRNTRINSGYFSDYENGIQIDTLICYGDVDLEFGVIHLVLKDPNGITNYGKFQISGSGVEHTIEGNFNNTDTGFFQVGNEVELSGLLNNAGVLFVVPHGNFSIDANMTNSGKIQIYDGFITCGCVMNNIQCGAIEGSGMIYSNNLINDGTIKALGDLHIATDGFIENSGLLYNSPLCTLRITHSDQSKSLANKGTIEVNAGGVAFNCELDNEPNGVIELKNGVIAASLIKHSKDATLKGFGGITGDLVMESESLVEITGPTYIIGDLYIGPDAIMRVSEGTTIVTGKTICEGVIELNGGHIVHHGGFEDK